MTHDEILRLWLAAYGAALVAFAARITFLLGFSPDPPEGVVQHAAWLRRRRWLIASEFAALPLFATTAVLAVVEKWLTPVSGVLFALIAGALGFAFFLHALDTVLRRRIGMDSTKPERDQSSGNE
jgi:hypothetical protein